MSGYYSLNKKGEYERSARLAHASIFLWQDGWERNKLYSQASRQIIMDLAQKTKTMVLDVKKDFIYASNNGNFRFSRRVAEQCAVYVRQSFFSRRFESKVTSLSRRWVQKKKKLMDKFPTAAKKPEHVGVLYGNMAKGIRAFRTNIRSEGEQKHTGYVVGIPVNVFSNDPVDVDDKRKLAKFFLKSNKQVKNKAKSKSKRVSLHSKLSWLEYGSARKKGMGQPARPLYSIAVKAYLQEAGFIVSGSPIEITKPGTKKSKVKKGSEAETLLKEDVRASLLRSKWKELHSSKRK